MADRNLDIALRIKAEMDQARTQLDQLNRSLGNTGKSAASATSGTRAQTAALSDLLAKIDPTIGKLNELDKQEAKLRQAKLSGLIDDEGFARFSAAIEKQRGELETAGKAIHSFSLNNSMARLELGRLSKDIATGQYSRFGQSALTLANYSGAMGAAFSGAGLAVLGTTAVLGAFAVAVVQGYLEEERLNKAIIATGNFAGVTNGEVNQLAASLGGANGKVGEARDILQGLIATGKFTGDTLGEVGRAAVNMAALSGKSAQEVVTEFSKMADDPVRAARELDGQFHVLTASVYLQIQALQDAGKNYEALQLLATTFADETGKRMDELHQHMSWLEKFASNWDNNGFSRIGRWAMDLGRPATEVDNYTAALKKYNDALADFKRSESDGSTKAVQDVFASVANKAYSDMQAAYAAAKKVQDGAKTTGDDKQNQAAGIAAVDRLHALEKGYDQVADKQAIVKKLNADLALQWKTTSTLPAGVDMTGANIDGPGAFDGKGYDFLLKKALGGSDQAKAVRSPRLSLNNDAAQRAADVAQQSQINTLIQMQAALDPATKAWADYNKVVADQDRLAATQKTVAGADVAAIDGRRNAIVGLADAARKAALDKLAEKDQQAWESLRDSLRTPAEVKLDTAMDKIKQLNALLDKGANISSPQYHDALKRIGENSVSNAPTYQGVDAAVGGVGSELAKNFQAGGALDDWHTQAIKDNEKFRTGDLANEESYQAGLAGIEATYAQKRKVIDDSRMQLALTASAQFFGELSQLSTSHNRKMAAIGKAAAIAQALITTYQSANNAFNALSGIPYIGPALGYAAAAAAIVAGLANVNQIRSQPTGFSGGGYTGPGGKFQPAGIVHAGEGVLSQEDIASLGGPTGFLALRAAIQGGDLHMSGYADGGYVSPLMDAPLLSAPAVPRMRLPDFSSANRAPDIHNHNFKFVAAFDQEQLAEQLFMTRAGEKAVVYHVTRNPSAIKASLR